MQTDHSEGDLEPQEPETPRKDLQLTTCSKSSVDHGASVEKLQNEGNLFAVRCRLQRNPVG